MSLESLLARDSFTHLRPVWGTDEAGGPIRTSETMLSSGNPCRVEDAGGNQEVLFEGKQMTVSRTVYTLIGSVFNGDFLTTSDGLRLRVISVKWSRSLGTIPSYFTYQCDEVRE